jgi:LacI family transcriptional regulator
VSETFNKTEKEVTIYDLARIVNVSTATVSRALRGDVRISKHTQEKIIELADKLCYQPHTNASDLRTKKTRLIGVIVHDLSSYFMASFLSGVEEIVREANYELIICHSAESAVKEATNAKQLFNRRVDGLIVSLVSDAKKLSHLEAFTKKNIPVIFFDRVVSESSGTQILIDNYKAGYEATLHLVQQGCRKLLHVAGNLKTNVYEERWKGFQEALSSVNLPCSEEQLITSDFSEKECFEIARKIASKKELPDGIFVSNDLCATICIRVFKEAGIKVPEQIAIVGFNNDPISRIVEPQLTTVNYPVQEMGILAAKNLMEQLDFPDLKNRNDVVMVRSNLIIRDSTKLKMK